MHIGMDIPDDIGYVVEGVTRFADLIQIEDVHRLVEWTKISTVDMECLAGIFERIRINRHWEMLDRMIEELQNSDDPEMSDFGRQIGRFVDLLIILARKQVGSFYDVFARDAPIEEMYAHPDWTKLPSELAYICDPAERYGLKLDEYGEGPFCDRLSPAERDELLNLATRMRAEGAYPRIYEWYKNHDNAESVLIDGLIGLLDELDYEYT